MAPNPHTLFHLVPINEIAHEALLHPDNKRFVSSSRDGSPGLEVGYHVPSMSRGHVITRLGRNADLILRHSSRGKPMSAVHVAFEVNPVTTLVVLSVRSKRISSVTFAVLEQITKGKETAQDDTSEQGGLQEEVSEDAPAVPITGDGVILYRQDYKLSIASYEFQLVWQEGSEVSSKGLVLQDYQTSLRLQQNIRSRDRPTEGDYSETLSWHITRFDSAKRSLFKDIPRLRENIGSGSYGEVYRACDEISGSLFAIKVVKLEEYSDVDAARAMLHREIKIMARLRHDHIIEYLGHEHFQTLRPEIFMPLREGSLVRLVKEKSKSIPDYENFCRDVLQQSLSALDYLTSLNVCHRDVKPDNILYYSLPDDGGYHFQLADFGLAHHHSLAKTFCGTGFYQAPELWPQVSQVQAAQSPKMDVFSLFATMAALHGRFRDFPPCTSDYRVVLNALTSKAPQSLLEPMARLHPEDRASAAQMLVACCQGKGLTTPLWKIPPVKPMVEKIPQGTTLPTAEPVVHPRTELKGGKTRPRRETASRPLIVYPPRDPRRSPADVIQPIRAHRDGISKRRAGYRAAGTPLVGPDGPSGKARRIPGAFEESP